MENVLKTKSFVKHSEDVNFLKNEHKVTHGFANTIVALSKEENETQLTLLKISISIKARKIYYRFMKVY